jgi:hypothetical protein
MPANPIELGVETAKELKINPKASPKAVYDEIVGSLVKQLELPENKYIWDQMVLEHPEWAGAPAAINSTNAGDYSQMRKEMMQRFLQLSKGLLYVKLWSSNEVKVTDFAKPVVFECDEVAQVPSMAGVGVDPKFWDNMAYGVYVNPEGKLVYRLEQTTEGWEQISQKFKKDFFCSYMMIRVTESQARGVGVGMSYSSSKQVYVDFKVLALDMRKITDIMNDFVWHEGFIKSK